MENFILPIVIGIIMTYFAHRLNRAAKKQDRLVDENIKLHDKIEKVESDSKNGLVKMKDNYIERFEDVKACSSQDKEEILAKLSLMELGTTKSLGTIELNQVRLFGEIKEEIAKIKTN
jgi:hypothetical protein